MQEQARDERRHGAPVDEVGRDQPERLAERLAAGSSLEGVNGQIRKDEGDGYEGHA